MAHDRPQHGGTIERAAAIALDLQCVMDAPPRIDLDAIVASVSHDITLMSENDSDR